MCMIQKLFFKINYMYYETIIFHGEQIFVGEPNQEIKCQWKYFKSK